MVFLPGELCQTETLLDRGTGLFRFVSDTVGQCCCYSHYHGQSLRVMQPWTWWLMNVKLEEEERRSSNVEREQAALSGAREFC